MKQKLVNLKNRLYIGAFFAIALLLGTPHAQAQLVSWDGTDLTFNVSDATGDILTEAAPIVAGGFVIVLFGIGVRLILRQVRRIRG